MRIERAGVGAGAGPAGSRCRAPVRDRAAGEGGRRHRRRRLPCRVECRRADRRPAGRRSPRADRRTAAARQVARVDSGRRRRAGRRAARSLSPLPPPFATNAARDAGRDFVLAIENDSFRPGRERPLREAVERFLAALTSRDRVAIVTMPYGGFRVHLTNDHARVASEFNKISGQRSASETGSEMACRTRRTLESLAGLVSGFARRRADERAVRDLEHGRAAPRQQPRAGAGHVRAHGRHVRPRRRRRQPGRASFYVIQPEDPMIRAGLPGREHCRPRLQGIRQPARGHRASCRRHQRGAPAPVGDWREHAGENRPRDRGLLRRRHRRAAPGSQRHQPPAGGARAAARSRGQGPRQHHDPARRAKRGRPAADRDAAGDAARRADVPRPAAARRRLRLGIARRRPTEARARSLEDCRHARTDRSRSCRSRPRLRACSTRTAASCRSGRRNRGTWRGGRWSARSSRRGAAPIACGSRRSTPLAAAAPRTPKCTPSSRPPAALSASSLVLGLSRGGGFQPRLSFGGEPVALGYVEVYGAGDPREVRLAAELARTLDGPPIVDAIPGVLRAAAGQGRLIGTVALPDRQPASRRLPGPPHRLPGRPRPAASSAPCESSGNG